MSDSTEVIKGSTAYQNGPSSPKAAIQAMGAVGVLRHRRKKTVRKKKLSKFERKFTALGPLLKPELKRIDYVLVHRTKTFQDEVDPNKRENLMKKERLREKFEIALKAEGFSIKAVEIGEHVYKKLHCPFKRLCKEAEIVKLEMPLKGCEKYPAERTTWITEFMENHFETDNEVDFISAPFKMNKIDLFDGYDNPTFFFRPALRSLLTHHILINLDVRTKEDADKSILFKREKQAHIDHYRLVEDFMVDLCSCCPDFFSTEEDREEDLVLSKMGLKYLLMKEAYTDSFILHEDSAKSKDRENKDKKKIEDPPSPVEVKPSDISDPRKELDDTWTVWWKFQPLWKIRNYFGEKIAIYFAWCGMMLTSLWIPVLFGLACFIYGLIESATRASDGIEMPGNLTIQEEIKWRMADLYDTLRGSFDNNVTPFFALIICLWGTVFLELWKRHIARLAYEWDVDQFEQNEPDRPQFFGTKVKKDPVTQEDNWFYPFKRQLLKFALSASALIFMIFIVFISLVAVIVYRVIISVDYCTELSAIECLITTTVASAVLNAISILLLGKFYDWVALKLTEWENHRTQTQYDNALIIKLFAFSFANSYASCFYIAFFRGRVNVFSIFGLGDEYNDECEGGSCMAQLSFQVLILMLAKPLPKFAKDILLPFARNLWRRRPECCRSNRCQNKVKDEEKKIENEDSVSITKSKVFLKAERLKPDLGDFTLSEYTEKVIMYGFLMLFATSFPLAPLIAMVWLAVDVRIDAKRLLWLNRRPIAFIAQDIGMWYGILNFVNLVGVVSNGFLIAFTSSWGDKYDVETQLWICLGFEHIVFALKFILAYMIPDVPKDVRLSIRREKYQVAKKFEDKGRAIDYRELVPSSTYDDKEDLLYDDKKQMDHSTNEMVPVKYSDLEDGVYEDSTNFAEFDDELSDIDDPKPPGPTQTTVDPNPSGPVLATLVEEQESIPSEPKESFMYSSVNMWYEVNDGDTANIEPLVNYAVPASLDDSHGVTSLRQVDPEGSNLLDSPSPNNATSTKLSQNTKSAFGREPTNMMSLEDMTSAPPVFGRGEESVEEESTTKHFPNDPKDVDPYCVVSNADMAQLNHDTQC